MAPSTGEVTTTSVPAPNRSERTAEAAAVRQTQRTREAAEPLDPAPGLLVVEADGANILSTDGWHEVKIGMVAGWDGDRLVAPSYVAAREPATTFGPRPATEAMQRKVRLARSSRYEK